MKIQAGLHIDHFGFWTDDLPGLAEALAMLGFSTGKYPVTGDVASCHYNFDHCYMECARMPAGPTMDLGPQSIRLTAKAMGLVAALGSLDVTASRETMMAAGFEVSGLLSSSRAADHGVRKGTARFSAVMFTPPGTFGKTFMPVVQHMTPELIYQDGRYAHRNRATGASRCWFAFPSPEAARAAAVAAARMAAVLEGSADPGGVPVAVILDPEGYRAEFGTEYPPESGDLVAVSFAGADKPYVLAQAPAAGLACWERDGRVFVDLRRLAGALFIFE